MHCNPSKESSKDRKISKDYIVDVMKNFELNNKIFNKTKCKYLNELKPSKTSIVLKFVNLLKTQHLELKAKLKFYCASRILPIIGKQTKNPQRI